LFVNDEDFVIVRISDFVLGIHHYLSVLPTFGKDAVIGICLSLP